MDWQSLARTDERSLERDALMLPPVLLHNDML
jgi:hypothetical protein